MEGRWVSVIVDSEGQVGLPVAVRGGVGITGVANLVGVGAADVPPDLKEGAGATGKERLLGVLLPETRCIGSALGSLSVGYSCKPVAPWVEGPGS